MNHKFLVPAIVLGLAALNGCQVRATPVQQIVDQVVTPDATPTPPIPVPVDYVGRQGVYFAPNDTGGVTLALNPNYAPDYPALPAVVDLPVARPRRG